MRSMRNSFQHRGRLRDQKVQKVSSSLFVGGAIGRKGRDLLLGAYQAAFEVVRLLLVVPGTGRAYQHHSLARQIQDAASDSRCPHVQMIAKSVDDATLAGLDRGSDAFVLPYRGEGFAMPLLEAMARGKPVITTTQGPSQDFCASQIRTL